MKLKFSTTKATSAVLHLNNKKAKCELESNCNNKTLPFCSEPKYLGVTLHSSLARRRHLVSLCKNLTSRVGFSKRLPTPAVEWQTLMHLIPLRWTGWLIFSEPWRRSERKVRQFWVMSHSRGRDFDLQLISSCNIPLKQRRGRPKLRVPEYQFAVRECFMINDVHKDGKPDQDKIKLFEINGVGVCGFKPKSINWFHSKQIDVN